MSKIKVEVVKPFERYKIGDKAELTAVKAATLEMMGLVKPANQMAEKQITKATP